ncbi:hypothetical protein [Histidinibacterium aquaticum]|uniref:Uncharacterized protein n=1 Tax=Histidinibacterium aquaticum TaxID=2613962 RepID=A0A5J5GCP2_9RHOB|nr:hypothetical protein [Histidinibacterium aquaticum]KAA9005936.1 hypothetical protein F3S47_15365 [Histidinibacterium aquaticum]
MNEIRLPNLAESYMTGYANSLALGQQVQEQRNRNALAELLPQHGAAAMQGDPEAMNALLAAGPQGLQAVNVLHGMYNDGRRIDQAERQIGQTDERIGLAREQFRVSREQSRREMEIALRDLDLRENIAGLEAEAEEGKRIAAQLVGIRSPEDWASTGREILGDNWRPWDQRGVIIGGLTGEIEAVESAIGGGSASMSDRTTNLPSGAYWNDPNDPTKGYTYGTPSNPEGAPQDPNARETKITDYMSTLGADRATAIKLADGQYDMTQDGLVVDRTTGQVIQPAAGGVQGQPGPTNVEASDAFDDTNVEGALGFSGMGAGIINTLFDSIGVGQPSARIDRGAQMLDSLATRTVQTLSAEWPGRPSNLTREMIDELTVRPGQIATGRDRARNKIANMRREIERAMQSAQRVIDNPGSYNAQERQAARSAMDGLVPLLEDYKALDEALNSGSGQPQTSGRTSSGIEWSVN